MVVFAEMEGMSGRPTSGALGALFTVLGMARLEETRFAVARDGTRVTRAQVRRLLSRTVLATVSPEGRAERGVLDDDPELLRLAELVQRELEIEYAREPPLVCPNEPGAWPGFGAAPPQPCFRPLYGVMVPATVPSRARARTSFQPLESTTFTNDPVPAHAG